MHIPADFESWLLDPEELEPNLVVALFGTATQERGSGDLQRLFAQAGVQKKIDDRGRKQEVEAWLNWQNWTMDKIFLQLKDTQVHVRSRFARRRRCAERLEAIEPSSKNTPNPPG